MHTQNREPDSAGDLLPKELENLRQNYMDSPATVSIETLGSIQRVNFLNISLNETHPDKYRNLMRVPFERVMRNLNRLHEAKTSKEIHFPVRISRVEDGTSGDQAFVEWVGAHFPLFKAFVQNRSDWMGAVSPNPYLEYKSRRFLPAMVQTPHSLGWQRRILLYRLPWAKTTSRNPPTKPARDLQPPGGPECH